MKHGPENELPPHTDAAPRDPATGLQLAGDAATLERTVRALQAAYASCERDFSTAQAQLAQVTSQWQQAEEHNRELRDDLAALRGWVQGEIKAARAAIQADRYDQDPKVRLQAFNEVWQRIKPVV